MDASKPKWVNSDDTQYWVSSLTIEGCQIIKCNSVNADIFRLGELLGTAAYTEAIFIWNEIKNGGLRA